MSANIDASPEEPTAPKHSQMAFDALYVSTPYNCLLPGLGMGRRCVATLVKRIALTDTATRLRAYLPASIAVRLDASPEGATAPKHPSQIGFDVLHVSTPCNCLLPGVGLGRRWRADRADRHGDAVAVVFAGQDGGAVGRVAGGGKGAEALANGV